MILYRENLGQSLYKNAIIGDITEHVGKSILGHDISKRQFPGSTTIRPDLTVSTLHRIIISAPKSHLPKSHLPKIWIHEYKCQEFRWHDATGTLLKYDYVSLTS